MDEGQPGLGSSVTELSPCSSLQGCLRFVIVVFPDHTHLLFLLYHLYKAVFFIALFPKAVSNISNVSCLDVWFATQNLIVKRCSRAVILLIRIICVTRFRLTYKDVKIGIVMSLTSASNQGHCLYITQCRKRLPQIFCLNSEFLVKTDESVKRHHVRRVALPLRR